jgi:hypothetical protein
VLTGRITWSPRARPNSGASFAASRMLPTEPVFIVSNARSGSTLLRYLLDAHPDIATP